jgi:hypothetical protein
MGFPRVGLGQYIFATNVNRKAGQGRTVFFRDGDSSSVKARGTLAAMELVLFRPPSKWS